MSSSTYYHGINSDIQAADGLQTLYLMNPNYVGFSDTQHQHHGAAAAANMILMNSAGANSLSPTNPPHAPPLPSQQTQHQQQFFGIPRPSDSDESNRPSHHYNLWGSNNNNQAITATAETQPQIPTAVPMSPYEFLRRPPPSMVLSSPRGLSLSLNSPQKQPTYTSALHVGEQLQGQISTTIPPTGGDNMRLSVSAATNGSPGLQSVVLGSKYLKAAQELLDEVVNVGGKKIKKDSPDGNKEKVKVNKDAAIPITGDGASGGQIKGGADLTTAQKQELQMKKAKLINMLDEAFVNRLSKKVEQRYRQYHHQMQFVASSFEQASGYGSAKSYTALALQTISKQFRCLKDAISSQIKAASKSLGEEDYCLGISKGDGSRLKFIDHQLRQQQALQQLGMMQHNAWRPQRGLPERAVSVLRAWLFEHFLHPYPKDSDKQVLAKQAGLTRSQVSNWFINARVRLWKPMVEEMYMEEIKDQDVQQNGSNAKNSSKNDQKNESGMESIAQQNSNKIKSNDLPKVSPCEISQSTLSTSPMAIGGGSFQAQAGCFNLIGSSSSSDMNQVVQLRLPKKPRISEMQNSPNSILSMDVDTKPEGYSQLSGITNDVNGFGMYHPIDDHQIGRFNPEQLEPRFHGNGVSLTLGLPYCENLSLSETQQGYLSDQNIQLGRGLGLGSGGEPEFCDSNTGYENINIQNRKRFAAQLLPDFVA